MVDDNFRYLKIQVLECVKELRDNGGPAACRFHTKLLKLIEATEINHRSQVSSCKEISSLQEELHDAKHDIVTTKQEITESQDQIDSATELIERDNLLNSKLSSTTEARDRKAAQMKNENEEFEMIIKAGPGWTTSQTKERDEIIQRIEEEKISLAGNASDLKRLKEELLCTEIKIKEKDHSRDKIMEEMRNTEEMIQTSNLSYLESQEKLEKVDNRVDTLKLNLLEEREVLSDLKSKHKRNVMKREAAVEKVNQTNIDIEKLNRKTYETRRNRDKLLPGLDKQIEKNKQIDVQNTEKVCQIGEKKRLIQCLSVEGKILQQKKDMISQKIIEIEKERISFEQERDKLKVQNNKIVHVEMIMKKRDNETKNRQREALKREMELVDRKKNLSEKSSNIIFDLIRSSERTLKTLQHDSEAFQGKAKEYEESMKNLTNTIAKDREETDYISSKIKDSLLRLRKEEDAIQHIQKELETAEVVLKQKQNMCEALKNECNTRSKALVANHEEIEKAKKDYNVVERQINLIKMDISHTEDGLVTEHFNHHHSKEEKEILQSELEHIREQILEIDNVLEGHNREEHLLHQSIHDNDNECDKFVKEYTTIVGFRDSIDTILLKKNEELEKIQEKIKIQQSVLNHSEADYQVQMSRIADFTDKLKQLSNQKMSLAKEALIFDEHVHKYNSLEEEVQFEKSRSMALKEELQRPFNVHRWRTLEHRNPPKFDKIKKIQKLQRYLIETADSIARRERFTRDIELEYLQTKRAADRQPQLIEVSEQLQMYQTTLERKNEQMKNIDVDLNLMKRKVDDLRNTLKALEVERKEMKSIWVDSIANQLN